MIWQGTLLVKDEVPAPLLDTFLNGLKPHVYISPQYQMTRLSHSAKKLKALVKTVWLEKSEKEKNSRLQRNA